MSRLFSALVASAAFLTISTPAFAQMSTSAPMTTTTPMAMKSPMSMSGAMTTKKMKCPSGETMVKGYTKSDGTKVAAYCRKSKM